jgi:hypothetical protein
MRRETVCFSTWNVSNGLEPLNGKKIFRQLTKARMEAVIHGKPMGVWLF